MTAAGDFTLTIACLQYDHTQPLFDESVRIAGGDATFETTDIPSGTFERVIRGPRGLWGAEGRPPRKRDDHPGAISSGTTEPSPCKIVQDWRPARGYAASGRRGRPATGATARDASWDTR